MRRIMSHQRSLQVSVLFVCLLLGAVACGTGTEDPSEAADDAADEGGDDATPEPDAEPEDAEEPTEEPEDTAADETAELEEFYSGNTLTWIVATSAGGPFDTYARTFARYMPRYIPGEPDIIVENMPGAGHAVAMNHIYQAAPRDGTVLGTATGGLALLQAFGDERVQFDMTELFYLGIPDRLATRVLVARQDAVPEGGFAAVVAGEGELVIGGSGPGSLLYDGPVLLRDVVGANVQVVPGYEGTSPLQLAMEQGEIDAHVGGYHSLLLSVPERLESGEWIILTKWADQDEGEPELADVPSVYDFVETDRERTLLRLGAGYPRSYTRLQFLPPAVPEARANALRRAFEQTMEDEDFLAEAEQLGLDISPISAEDTEAAINDILQMPSDLRDELQEILGVE